MIDQRWNTFKHFGESVGPVGGKGFHEAQVDDLLQRVGCFVGSGLLRDAKRTSSNEANLSVGCIIHSLS